MRIALDPGIEDVTKAVLGAAFEVSGALGHGFLEAVYRKALVHELRTRGLDAEEEVPFPVRYKDHPVGTYQADLVVNRCVIVELKATEAILAAHIGQVLNYLRASGLSVGLLLNFGKPQLQYKRVLL